MPHRINSLSAPDIAQLLGAHALFTATRELFGGADDATSGFEGALEFDPVSGRLEAHLFATALADEALIHLIAARHHDLTIAPSVISVGGEILNARRMSRELFRDALSYIGQARGIQGEAAHSAHLAYFEDVLRPRLLAELAEAHPVASSEAELLLHWGAQSSLSAVQAIG